MSVYSREKEKRHKGKKAIEVGGGREEIGERKATEMKRPQTN